jgi:membrane protein
MARFIPQARKSYEFISDKLWKVRINKVDRRQGLFIRQARVFALAFKGFSDDKCLTAATALTFYTLFSIVPILALVFAIAKGFGYEKDLEQQILNNYVEYAEVLSNSFVYANALLSTTKGGVIAGIGIVLLLWSVMQLLINIENSFNIIWHVRVGRSWFRKVTDYLTIMLVAPLFLIVSITLTIAIQTKVSDYAFLGFAGTLFMKGISVSLIAAIFLFLFMALPNTKVNYKYAITAAIISAIAFELLSWGYVRFQVGANRLNAIYGGFAALPLFLIWVQYNWYIVLFGAEISFAYQNVDHYELEEDIQNLSVRYKKVIALLIANLVTKRFYNREKSLTLAQISDKLDLPSRLTANIINEFVEAGIFVEVKTNDDKEIVYQPGITESKFTVKYLIDTLERKGVNTLPITDSSELQHINDLMQELDKSTDTELGHLNLKDIVK